MAHDASPVLAEASAGLVRFGYYTSVLLLFHEDVQTIEALARDVRAAFRNHGFPARIETLNAVEAYLGSLLEHGYLNVRRPMIHTLNLAGGVSDMLIVHYKSCFSNSLEKASNNSATLPQKGDNIC